MNEMVQYTEPDVSTVRSLPSSASHPACRYVAYRLPIAITVHFIGNMTPNASILVDSVSPEEE